MIITRNLASQYPSTLALRHMEDDNFLLSGLPRRWTGGTSMKRKMQCGHTTRPGRPSWRWNRWSCYYWCCWGRETQPRWCVTYDTIKTWWSWHFFCWLLQWEPTRVLQILYRFEMLNNGSHGRSFWWLLVEASLCYVSHCSCAALGGNWPLSWGSTWLSSSLPWGDGYQDSFCQ